MPEETTAPENIQAEVKRWTSRILRARSHWEPDFERMLKNMEFAGSIQWNSQEDMESSEYLANFINQVVQHKTAMLYAKNPRAIYERRPRLDFSVWDGDIGSLQTSMMQLAVNPFDMNAAATLLDYQEGTRQRRLVERIGETLEIAYQYQIDRQSPSFKLRMKQLVRRVCTCGVGFVRMDFIREGQETLEADPESPFVRQRQAAGIVKRMQEGEVSETDAESARLAYLQSAEYNRPNRIPEYIRFSFPSVTRIIIDPDCLSIKGFVGAGWIAQVYRMDLDKANAIFDTEMSPGGGLKTFQRDGTMHATMNEPAMPPFQAEETYVDLFEVFDREDGSTFIIADGWPEYLVAPQPMRPWLSGFWPIFGLSFNDIEVEDGQKATIYPPSDVQLAMHPQKEHNRQREDLRRHRRANRPKYLTTDDWLTKEDEEKLRNAQPNEVIKLKGVPPGTKPGDLLAPMVHAPVDPALYDSSQIKEDLLLVTGIQEANIGPLTGATATESTIAEQSRMTAGASNVDDMDDFLSVLAEAGGEMLLQEMSKGTFVKIVGRGAVVPEGADRDAYLDEIFLKVEASSSGRPNKAIDVANFERLMPLLLQAGANPAKLVQEGAKVLFDGRLDVNEFLPVGPPMMGSPAAQPLQSLMSQSPVPLLGANPR